MRNQMKIVGAAMAFVLAAGVSAQAEDLPSEGTNFEKWGEAGGFNIFVDKARGTCMAERGDEYGYVIQMGVIEEGMGYLGVFTNKDIDLGSGKDLIVTLGDHMYTADAISRANLSNEYSGGYLRTNNPNFVKDVIEQSEMEVFTKSDASFSVSLDGTAAAIEAARQCIAEQSS